MRSVAETSSTLDRDAPGQELRVTRHIIHQGKHLCGCIGDQGTALDDLHALILRQKRGRRHRRIGRLTSRCKPPEKLPPIAVNRKARFDYFIEERFEAGISLMGWEVKSMRAGKAQIAEAYVYVKNGEAFLFGAHINALNSASTHVDTDPTRTRKLLLNRRELDHLIGAVERRGYTIVPLRAVLEGRARQARDRPGQRQEAARQAPHGKGSRLAARQGPNHEGDAPLSR